MEQYEVIITIGMGLGAIVAGFVATFARLSAISTTQKTNKENISELQKQLQAKDDKIRRIEVAAARMYGQIEAYTRQITYLQSELKTLEGHKNDLARLFMNERHKWQQDKAKYESQIALLRNRVNHLEQELKKYQPVGAAA